MVSSNSPYRMSVVISSLNVSHLSYINLRLLGDPVIIVVVKATLKVTACKFTCNEKIVLYKELTVNSRFYDMI